MYVKSIIKHMQKNNSLH